MMDQTLNATTAKINNNQKIDVLIQNPPLSHSKFQLKESSIVNFQ